VIQGIALSSNVKVIIQATASTHGGVAEGRDGGGILDGLSGCDGDVAMMPNAKAMMPKVQCSPLELREDGARVTGRIINEAGQTKRKQNFSTGDNKVHIAD